MLKNYEKIIVIIISLIFSVFYTYAYSTEILVSKNNDNAVIFVKNVNKENYDLAELIKEAPEHDVCIIKKSNMSEFALNMNAVKKFVKFKDLSRGDFVIGEPVNILLYLNFSEIFIKFLERLALWFLIVVDSSIAIRPKLPNAPANQSPAFFPLIVEKDSTFIHRICSL